MQGRTDSIRMGKNYPLQISVMYATMLVSYELMNIMQGRKFNNVLMLLTCTEMCASMKDMIHVHVYHIACHFMENPKLQSLSSLLLTKLILELRYSHAMIPA